VFARPVRRHDKGFTVHARMGALIAVPGLPLTAERLLAHAEAAMHAGEATVWARPESR